METYIDILDKEIQIIHKEFINERESRNNQQDFHYRLQNIDDLTDMGFNLTRFSPIPTTGDMAPQTPLGSRTTTPVLTSTPRPNGGSRLHSSDPTSNKRYADEGNIVSLASLLAATAGTNIIKTAIVFVH